MSSRPLTGMLSARVVLRVVDFCQARGHDAEVLCRGAGLSRRALLEPDARVSYEAVERLGQRALALTGDENFGLHLAQDVRDTQHFDTGLLLLMASPTVGEAIARMVRYQRYWGDGERVQAHRGAGGVTLRYVLAGTEGAYARHSDECALAEVAIGIRTLAGQELWPRAVRFRHRAPADTREHTRLFGPVLEFDAAHSEIAFGDEVLAARMPGANEVFSSVFAQQIERALARLPATASSAASVREAARVSLSAGRCTLACTARALGVSARTLQRRLQAEGTSFDEIVDALRREMSLAYLERQVPVAEIASLLGYSDATSFHHAFRRWTGVSPLRYARGDCSTTPEG